MSRFDYVAYDEKAQQQQNAAKSLVTDIEADILLLGPGREQSLALTKLEECYMWIGKAIRNNQIARNGSAPLQEERKDA